MADLGDKSTIIEELLMVLYSNTNTKVPPNISPPEYKPPEYKPPKMCLKTFISPGLIFGILRYSTDKFHQLPREFES